MLVGILLLAVVIGLLVVLVRLTERHHRNTWGDGPQGQEPSEPYEPKIWHGQVRGPF